MMYANSHFYSLFTTMLFNTSSFTFTGYSFAQVLNPLLFEVVLVIGNGITAGFSGFLGFGRNNFFYFDKLSCILKNTDRA